MGNIMILLKAININGNASDHSAIVVVPSMEQDNSSKSLDVSHISNMNSISIILKAYNIYGVGVVVNTIHIDDKTNNGMRV